MLQLFKAKMLPKSLVEVRKISLVKRFFSVQSQQRLSVQWANQNWLRIRAASIKRGKKVCDHVMIVRGLRNIWLVYNRRVFGCSRLNSVLSVSIVYPPNWRIMCTSSFPRSTHCTAWLVWAHQSITLPLRLGFEIVVSYAAFFCDVKQRSFPQERKRSNLVPRFLVDEADFVNKRSG